VIFADIAEADVVLRSFGPWSCSGELEHFEGVGQIK